MSFKQSFQKNVDRWQDKEEEVGTLAATTDNILSGFLGPNQSSEQVEEALSGSANTQSLPSRTQSHIQAAMRHDGASRATYANIVGQEKRLGRSEENLKAMKAAIEDLQSLFNNPPDRQSDRQTLSDIQDAIDTLETLPASPPASRQNNATARQKTASGSLREAVSDLIETRTTRSTEYHINTLDFQFYQYGTPDTSVTTSSKQPSFETPNGDTLDDVYINGTVTVQPDGTIATESGDKFDIKLPPSPPSRTQQRLQETSQAAQDLEQAGQQLADDYAYEAWACAVFGLIGQARDAYDDIQQQAQEILDMVDVLTELSQGKRIGLQGLEEIKKNVSALQDAEALLDSANEQLDDTEAAFYGTLEAYESALGSSQGKGACDALEEAVCQSHGRAVSLHDRLKEYAPPSIGYDAVVEASTQAVTDALPNNLQPDTWLEKLVNLYSDYLDLSQQLDSHINRLESIACEWVAEGIEGLPSSLRKALDVITQLLSMIPSIQALLPSGALKQALDNVGLDESMPDLASKLEQNGFDRFSELVERGKITEAVNMADERMTTHAGKTAKDLDEAAQKADNEADAAELRELSRIAATRHEQKTAHDKIREGIKRRRQERPYAWQAKYIDQQASDILNANNSFN